MMFIISIIVACLINFPSLILMFVLLKKRICQVVVLISIKHACLKVFFYYHIVLKAKTRQKKRIRWWQKDEDVKAMLVEWQMKISSIIHRVCEGKVMASLVVLLLACRMLFWWWWQDTTVMMMIMNIVVCQLEILSYYYFCHYCWFFIFETNFCSFHKVVRSLFFNFVHCLSMNWFTLKFSIVISAVKWKLFAPFFHIQADVQWTFLYFCLFFSIMLMLSLSTVDLLIGSRLFFFSWLTTVVLVVMDHMDLGLYVFFLFVLGKEFQFDWLKLVRGKSLSNILIFIQYNQYHCLKWINFLCCCS